MITLAILPASGNINNFPFTGVLGVTDVVVRGRLVAGLDERASGKPPEIRRLGVRLVRVDVWDGKAAREVTKTVVDEKEVWTPPNGVDAERIVPGEHRFALKVPHDVAGLSKMQFKVGSCHASVAWRIEAYVDTVKSGRVDAQHSRTLSLVRHAARPLFPPEYLTRGWSASTDPSSSTAPFDYELRIPNQPFGVLEPLAVETRFRLPKGSGVHIKSLKLWLRRDVTHLKSGVRHHNLHDFAIEGGEPRRTGRSSRRFVSVFNRSSSSVGPAATTRTPPSEDDRMQSGRTPSPGSDSESTALASHRFPLIAHDGMEVVERGRLNMRIPGQGPHRWTVGETGESSVFRLSFLLAGKITYKVRNGSSLYVDLAPLPVYVCAAVDSRLSRTPYRASTAPTLVSRPSHRRKSDVDLQLKFERTSPSPSDPPLASPDASTERRLSNAALPLAIPPRPQHGRRMSEQSEAIDAPARTRVRRDPPAPLPLSNATMHSPSSSGSSPPAVSRSSTIETLGPITPHATEFLIPAAGPSLPFHHSPPKTSPYPTSSCSPTMPQLPRYGPRSVRSLARYRPASASSQRSSILGDSSQSVSNLSIRSVASVSSSASDPLRPALSTGASSTTLLASADRMLGLSLGGDDGGDGGGLMHTSSSPSYNGRLLVAPEEGADSDTRMDSVVEVQAPHQPSPSPPSSPEVALRPLSSAPAEFSNPFISVSSAHDAPPPAVGASGVPAPVIVRTEMYVSPRHAGPHNHRSSPGPQPGKASSPRSRSDTALPSGLTAPASPPLPPSQPNHGENRSGPPTRDTPRLLSPAAASSVLPGEPSVTSGRKGSISLFLSNMLGRRGSKPLTAS